LHQATGLFYAQTFLA